LAAAVLRGRRPDEAARRYNRHDEPYPAMKIKIEVVERAGWWQVKVCGLRHSRYRSQPAARLGAKRLAARLKKLSLQARSRAGRMQLGQRLRVAHCELYCIRTLLRGRR
jgi:hypothetical protein